MRMLFDTNKVFRIYYQTAPQQAPATRSLPNQELAVQFIRHVLDERGSIAGIKYNGKPVSEESQTSLMESAKSLKWKKDHPRPHLR